MMDVIYSYDFGPQFVRYGIAMTKLNKKNNFRLIATVRWQRKRRARHWCELFGCGFLNSLRRLTSKFKAKNLFSSMITTFRPTESHLIFWFVQKSPEEII